MKCFLSILFLLLSSLVAQAANVVIEVPLYREYFLNLEPNATLIYDQKAPVKITKVDATTYRITVNQSLAKTTLVVLDSTGVKNYFIKGQNPDEDKTKKNSNSKRLLKGYVKYSNSINKNLTLDTKSQTSSAQWYNQLWFTEEYSFISNFSYTNNYVPDEYVLDDYFLKFSKDLRTGNKYYLYYGSLTELIDRPYGFLGNNYRGYIFSYSDFLGLNWVLWNAKLKTVKNGALIPNNEAHGGNVNYTFNSNKIGLGYTSNGLNKIYNANTNFNWANAFTTSLSSSTDGKVYILSAENNIVIPKDYQYLGLQILNYSVGYIPEYSFGLYQTIPGKREDHKITANFSNQDVPLNVDQNELELIPGVLSTMLTFNYTKFDLYQRDYSSINTIYNTSYLFSGISASYEKSYLLDQLTETVFAKPYIELFFSGKMGRGWSLRNSHTFNYKTSYFPVEQTYNQQNTTLGLYYTDIGFRYGVFGGTGQDNIDSVLNTAGASTFLYGADGFWKRGRLGYNLNYTHTEVRDTNVYSDAFKATMNFYNKEHQLSLNAVYKRNKSSIVNEDLQAAIAYTYNYDYGDYTLSESISHLRTSIHGKVCKDVNFNNKCDEGDTLLKDVEVSLSRDPVSETVTINNDGTFSFSNLPPRSFFLTLNKVPANFQTFKSLNVDLSAGAGTYEVEIPLVETEIYKVRPLLKGKYMPYIPINLMCHGILFNKTEIMTDYLAMTKPKGVECEENLDFSSLDENIYVRDSMVTKDGVKEYQLESSFKQIKGVLLFGEKPTKTKFYMNDQLIESDDDGSFVVIVDDKNPRISFSKPGYSCQTSPSYDIFYKDINKFLAVTIRCNPR